MSSSSGGEDMENHGTVPVKSASEKWNILRLCVWFMWSLVILATASTFALWASLEHAYGSSGGTHSFLGSFHALFDTTSYNRRKLDVRYVGGTQGQPAIVCPEIDIPGSERNVSINVNETTFEVVEQELFKMSTQDVREFSQFVTQDVQRFYDHVDKVRERGLRLSDVVDEGILVEKDYIVIPGGHWIPMSCLPRWKVAIIIPFRDRFVHLPIILRHLIPYLKSQYLEFGIFIVEQANNLPFNRAMLMNVGFVEALNFTKWDCFVFHDVDHIPLSPKNSYGCGTMPKHFLSGADRWNYKLLYGNFFGAVTGFTRNQVFLFNGFPNAYWGWGGEDDDILGRMRSVKLFKFRPWGEMGFYNVIPHHHKSAKKNVDRVCLLTHYKERLKTDGLNNLAYPKPKVTLLPLYTNVSVNIDYLPWNDNWLECKESFKKKQ